MAIEPQNLIQVQSRLQDPSVQNDDLIKFANGSNPQVPSFLALIEMNRRKQITNTADAFNQSTKDSIKNQVASALTQPQAGVNMGANPFTKNLTNAAPGVNMSGNPATTDVAQGLAGINPAALPPQPSTSVAPMTAANGGLMSLPMDHFKTSSYAGGGIVAFGDPRLNPDEEQLVSSPQARPAGSKILSDAQILAELRAVSQASDVPDSTAKTPAPGSYQGILAGLPKMEAPVEKTPEELYAAKKERDRMAGVSADPYADVKVREAAREARQQANYGEQGLDRLLAQMTAFATADPSKGIGYQGAVSAKVSDDIKQQQNALRDKEEAAQIEFARAMAKEEDGRKRGDSEAVLAAQKEQQDAKFKFQKVEHDRGVLAANIYQTTEYAAARKQAAADANANKPTAEEKKLLKVQTTVNAHPAVRAIADAIKQGNIQQGTPEYYDALKRINEIARPLYIQADLTPPEDIIGSVPDTPPVKEPGLLERIFGPSKPANKTVSFNDLPK
jgi:hypothetical protein